MLDTRCVVILQKYKNKYIRYEVSRPKYFEEILKYQIRGASSLKNNFVEIIFLFISDIRYEVRGPLKIRKNNVYLVVCPKTL